MPKMVIGRITEISYSNKPMDTDYMKNYLDVDIDIIHVSEN